MTYDIVLINTHREHFGATREDISIGTNLLTVYLRKQGYAAEMFRGAARESLRWLEETMRVHGARSIGFYCDYENVTLVAELSRQVKQRWRLPVFVGGPQAIALKEEFFADSGCDVVVLGEAEFALRDLLACRLNGTGKLSDIDGIAYLDQAGRLVVRPHTSVIEDLDALPSPDFRIEPRAGSWTVMPIISGRGCPYRCAFCYEGSNVQKVRFRSVEKVLKEIEDNFAWNPNWKYVFFIDDTFTLSPERVTAFCDGLEKIRRKHDFVWFCEGHVQTLHRWPEMLTRMAAVGLAKLFIGIESGADQVLELYRKQTSAAMIETVVRKAAEAGIPQITGNVIVGGPIESPETVRGSCELICRLLRIAPGRFDALGFFLVPYPDTPISLEPERFGLRILADREQQSLEDMPLSETDAVPWSEMFTLRNELNRQVIETMTDLYREGEIPYASICSNYEMAQRYGCYSRWYLNVFAGHPIRDRYFRLLTRRALSRSADLPPEVLPSWHPRRVFEIWNNVTFAEGYPSLEGMVLSPLEFELLLLCSGKIRLGEVLERAYATFGDRHPSRAAFDEAAIDILNKFERNYWLGYSRF